MGEDKLAAPFTNRPAGQSVTARLSGTMLGQPVAVTLELTVPDNGADLRAMDGEAVRQLLETAFHATFGMSELVAHEPISEVEFEITGERDSIAHAEAMKEFEKAAEEAKMDATMDKAFGDLGKPGSGSSGPISI